MSFNFHQLYGYFSGNLMPFGRNSKKPVMLSEAYLKWIRTQPCIITGVEACDAHHVIFKSQAENDYSAVPLRHDLHMKLHSHKQGVEGFEEEYGICFKTAVAAKLMEYLHTQKKQ
jgi:hypothetical protein